MAVCARGGRRHFSVGVNTKDTRSRVHASIICPGTPPKKIPEISALVSRITFTWSGEPWRRLWPRPTASSTNWVPAFKPRRLRISSGMTTCPFERNQDAADPLYHKAPVMKTLPFFQPSDFTYDEEARTWVCPAGKPLESQDRHARGARSMPNVSARSSPCSGMCGTTRGSIGSPYADAPRLTGNGSSSAWSTTSKSSPVTDRRGKNTPGRRTNGHQWRADSGRN